MKLAEHISLTPEDVVNRFLSWERASRDSLEVKRCYVDVAGDLVAGVMLSQIVYWHLPSKDGKCRLTVERNGEMWLAKKREDWWEECRITLKQVDRSLALLESKGLIETALFQFQGHPTKHVRLKWADFLDALECTLSVTESHFTQTVKSILPKGENASSPKGEFLYTETTSKDYSRDNFATKRNVGSNSSSNSLRESNSSNSSNYGSRSKSATLSSELEDDGPNSSAWDDPDCWAHG